MKHLRSKPSVVHHTRIFGTLLGLSLLMIYNIYVTTNTKQKFGYKSGELRNSIVGMHTCTGNTTLSIPESTVNTSTFSLVWNVMLFCIIMHILLFTHLQGKLLLSTLLIIYRSPFIITYSLIVANTPRVINYFSLSFIQNHWDQGDMFVHI